VKLTTLKKRSEFLAVRGGPRAPLPAFVLEAKANPAASPGIAGSVPRVGFTVTKALGNAVIRNRIRRRLKAAVTAILDHAAKPGFDYVVIARSAASERDFDQLKSDLERAFQRVHQPSAPKDRQHKGKKQR
jgi:ribonuclease P protein component